MKRMVICLFIGFLIPELSAQIELKGQVLPGIPAFEMFNDSLIKQLVIYPQEKMHLHTDRNRYIPGEKIWFKAYVTDALTHESPTYSNYVYVELMNASDSLLHRVMIRKNKEGLFYGHLFLADLIPEGMYTLRAYTRYMENQGDDYFFKKSIHIGSLSSETEKNTRKQLWRKLPKEDYSVTFFPEGGQLIDDVFCRVAFKALHETGYPAEIVGELVDEAGEVITESETVHAGMGSFVFMPVAGKKYSFRSKNKEGLEKQFELPTARSTVSLSVASRSNDHLVTLNTSPAYTGNSLYLFAHSGGLLQYFAPWNPEKKYITFAEDFFPSGVIQFVLFDQDLNPLSERLLFNRTDDQAQAVFVTDRTEYGKREKVTGEIYITDAEGEENRLAGHLSVAITDDKDIAVDSLTTIYTSLLLSSELKGFIESPGYYLQDNAASKSALNLLMMTHGWRRYDLPEVFKGHYEQPVIPYEESKNISGTVKTLLSEKPIINGEITVVTNDGNFGKTYSDSTGCFWFYGIDEYPDSTVFFVQAKKEEGNNRLELIMHTDTFPEFKNIAYRVSESGANVNKKEMDDFLRKAAQRTQYDDDLRLINLSEIEVTGKRRANQEKESGFVSKVMRRDEIERTRMRSMSHLLMWMGYIIDDTNSAQSVPTVFIDGFPMSRHGDPLASVNPDDVERVEIYRHPYSRVFGIHGDFDVISITTRRGTEQAKSKIRYNYASFMPLGYQKPAEFYAPKYDTPAAKNLSNPDYRTTLFWKPNLVVSDEEEQNKATFEFYTSDFSGTYSVVIEGLSVDGKIIRQVETISVK